MPDIVLEPWDEDEDGFDRDCRTDMECCFPGQCVMPGEHLSSECATAEMMQQMYEEGE